MGGPITALTRDAQVRVRINEFALENIWWLWRASLLQELHRLEVEQDVHCRRMRIEDFLFEGGELNGGALKNKTNSTDK